MSDPHPQRLLLVLTRDDRITIGAFSTADDYAESLLNIERAHGVRETWTSDTTAHALTIGLELKEQHGYRKLDNAYQWFAGNKSDFESWKYLLKHHRLYSNIRAVPDAPRAA